ncbi:MAG: hypothetical protein H7Y00_09065, partial [Fimbriimonadaceae bacterium]|nr:hypothetical protein [Chitinophagales bacterium]
CALATETAENEIISISGLKGRDPKEIKVENLAKIIQARMEEILEHVYHEIRMSGYAKKLIAGIVVTGGGAQLKHIVQLVEYISGLDTRVGYPTEHLTKTKFEEIRHPMYATGVGLILKGQEDRFYVPQTEGAIENKTTVNNKTQITQNIAEENLVTEELVNVSAENNIEENKKDRTSWFNSILSNTKRWFEEDEVSDFK